MKFEISKSSLVKALSNVNGAVEKRNTIPILLNVKIEALAGKIRLVTTDMDIVVISMVEAKVENEGQTTVPAQLFYDIVRKIPDGTNISIELPSDGSSIKIQYNKSKFSLPCLSAEEFPILSEGEVLVNFTIDSSELVRIIDNTRFAISSDETRHYLNGMFLHAVEKDGKVELRGVATDGHRLALSSANVSSLKSSVPGIIIPRKTTNEIRRIIEDNDKVAISISKGKIKVICGDSVVISKLIDGEFPEYDKVVPKDNNQLVLVDRKVIFNAIDRVATIATDKNRSIKLILDSGKISLQVSTSDGGFADEEIEVDFKGNKIEAGFNSRYLLEIIGQIEEEKLNIKFKDGNSPILIEVNNGLYVIMPVRI